MFGNAPTDGVLHRHDCFGTLPEDLGRRRNAVGAIAINSREPFMISHLENCKQAARHERAISALTQRTGAPLAEVRALFAEEFARLAQGAKVRSYLVTCTASNVLAALREKRRPLIQ